MAGLKETNLQMIPTGERMAPRLEHSFTMDGGVGNGVHRPGSSGGGPQDGSVGPTRPAAPSPKRSKSDKSDEYDGALVVTPTMSGKRATARQLPSPTVIEGKDVPFTTYASRTFQMAGASTSHTLHIDRTTATATPGRREPDPRDDGEEEASKDEGWRPQRRQRRPPPPGRPAPPGRHQGRRLELLKQRGGARPGHDRDMQRVQAHAAQLPLPLARARRGLLRGSPAREPRGLPHVAARGGHHHGPLHVRRRPARAAPAARRGEVRHPQHGERRRGRNGRAVGPAHADDALVAQAAGIPGGIRARVRQEGQPPRRQPGAVRPGQARLRREARPLQRQDGRPEREHLRGPRAAHTGRHVVLPVARRLGGHVRGAARGAVRARQDHVPRRDHPEHAVRRRAVQREHRPPGHAVPPRSEAGRHHRRRGGRDAPRGPEAQDRRGGGRTRDRRGAGGHLQGAHARVERLLGRRGVRRGQLLRRREGTARLHRRLPVVRRQRLPRQVRREVRRHHNGLARTRQVGPGRVRPVRRDVLRGVPPLEPDARRRLRRPERPREGRVGPPRARRPGRPHVPHDGRARGRGIREPPHVRRGTLEVPHAVGVPGRDEGRGEQEAMAQDRGRGGGRVAQARARDEVVGGEGEGAE
ncbi:hypothetical protein THAOC_04227, partial [Thalassiosira oceanica]